MHKEIESSREKDRKIIMKMSKGKNEIIEKTCK